MVTTLNGRQAATGRRTGEYVEGPIEAMNERGIRIDGRWLNYSTMPGKTSHDLMPHEIGQRVVAYVTGGKWIGELQDPDPFADGDWRPHPLDTQRDHELGTALRPRPEPAPAPPAVDRELRAQIAMARAVALKAAATVCASWGEQDILGVAEQLEAWLVRERF